MKDCVCSLMVELWIVTPNCVGSTPIRHPNILAYPLTLIQSRKGNWSHGGSSPSASTILEYLSSLRVQSAKLVIRGFKSHLQVYKPL